MDNNLSKQYDVLEFVKEIAPEMDLSKINMTELALKKDAIKEVISEAHNRELSVEEREATEFLEIILDIEPGEEISEEVVEVVPVANSGNEIGEIVSEDLDLLVAPVDPLTSALVYEIQGGGNYQARLAESAKSWEQIKNTRGKGRVFSKEYSR